MFYVEDDWYHESVRLRVKTTTETPDNRQAMLIVNHSSLGGAQQAQFLQAS